MFLLLHVLTCNKMLMNITPEGSLLLAFTSLGHLYATPFAPTHLYKFMIQLSTLFRFVWHLSNAEISSPLGVFTYASYDSLILLDTWISYETPYFYQILYINFVMTLIMTLLPWLEKKGILSYTISQSIWNLVNAAKTIYVTVSLNLGMKEVLE